MGTQRASRKSETRVNPTIYVCYSSMKGEVWMSWHEHPRGMLRDEQETQTADVVRELFREEAKNR